MSDAAIPDPAIALATPLIAKHEGCVLHPYLCPAGVWTIGYGHTPGVTATGAPITQAQADALLAADVALFAGQVRKIAVPLQPHQEAALISFAFNLGLGALGKSTLLRLVNAGDIAGAADEFPKWVHAGGAVLPGLVARRDDERALFLGQSV